MVKICHRLAQKMKIFFLHVHWRRKRYWFSHLNCLGAHQHTCGGVDVSKNVELKSSQLICEWENHMKYEVSHLRSIELSTLFSYFEHRKTRRVLAQQSSWESTAQIRKFHFDAAASHTLDEDILQIILSFNARTKHGMCTQHDDGQFSLFLCQHNIFWNSKHHQFVFCRVRQRFYHKLETIIAHFASAFVCTNRSTICTDHFSI